MPPIQQFLAICKKAQSRIGEGIFDMNMKSDERCLVVERTEHQLGALLNRPQRANALNLELVERLLATLDGSEKAGVQLVTIAGRGKHFCAGFDLSEIDTLSDGDLLLRFVRIESLLQRIYHAPFLTVATVQGHTIGAGVDLFCACEIRIATEDTMFRMPGWRFGIALGTRRLTSRVGRGVARSLLSSAKLFDAKTALQIGLVTRIAPEPEWPTIIAEELGSRSQISRHSYADLVRATVPDTRDADMAALVETASRPGLSERIRSYIDTGRSGWTSRPR